MDDMQMEWMRTLRHFGPQCGGVRKVKVFEKNSRGWCICLHHPSVAVDRYRLVNENQLNQKIN